MGQIIKGFEGYKIDDEVNIMDWYSEKEFNKANEKYDEILKNLDDSEISTKIKDDIVFKKQLLKELGKNKN